MSLFSELSEKIAGKNLRIVFPESYDERIQGAVVRLKAEKLVEPVLLGNPESLKAKAKDRGFDLGDIEIIDPANYDDMENMVQAFVERRKGKATE